MLGLEALEWGLILVAFFLGAIVQGSVGFGVGTVGAPILAFVDITFVPSSVLLLGGFMAGLALLRERREVNWWLFAWVSVGRVPGVVLGTAIVVLVPGVWISLLLAGSVLGALLAGALRVFPRINLRNALVTGFLSGAIGTATSIGGTPLSVLMRSQTPSVARSTISAIFFVGCLMSLASLGMAGAVTLDQLLLSAVIVPAIIGGLLVSNYAIKFLRARAIFTIGICSSIVGALLLIGDSLSRLASA